VEILTTVVAVRTTSAAVDGVSTAARGWDVPEKRSRSNLGERLREFRESHGWSLREVAAKAEVNHGYLSQLERGEVAEPAPSMLHKVSAGYGVPFPVLMRWAGYVEESESDPSPIQEMALSYLGDDVSEEEFVALRAVLNAIRSKRATYGPLADSLDSHLEGHEVQAIRGHVLALLRRADALNVVPTPLEQVMEVAQLVAAGEITLDEEEKRQLRKKFGSMVDLVLSKLRGAVHFRAREIWVQPDLYVLKKRFVTAHEIGHDLLPWQRDVIAYIDDEERLRPDVRVGFEREANQAAVELLAQGDMLRREADDSPLSLPLISQLSTKYQISLQATARRVVEETRQEAALALRFRSRGGGVGPCHVYCSNTFEKRFGWTTGTLPHDAKGAMYNKAKQPHDTFYAVDLSATFVEMEVETVHTRYARLTLYTPTARGKAPRRWLHLG
jgi:transcriptional regulator with XRE-family HTH domain